ncbi:hypothetical protein B0T14DRAFT_293776 [Immersiella caudata]|uniref:Uncharacterized protein n=1 Tax=Immersiella caudata TaxID=314043 RepID=A0AA39WER6_9PEZI|nr:hypothetical protein B0T14DRAFT_293776 [Immersiella caudata]
MASTLINLLAKKSHTSRQWRGWRGKAAKCQRKGAHPARRSSTSGLAGVQGSLRLRRSTFADCDQGQLGLLDFWMQLPPKKKVHGSMSAFWSDAIAPALHSCLDATALSGQSLPPERAQTFDTSPAGQFLRGTLLHEQPQCQSESHVHFAPLVVRLKQPGNHCSPFLLGRSGHRVRDPGRRLLAKPRRGGGKQGEKPPIPLSWES